MKTFHICFFIISQELCSGTNVTASTYNEALSLFEKNYPNKEILYISQLNK